MTRSPRPDLAPDASRSRAEMERLQHEIAAVAVFDDAFPADSPFAREGELDTGESAAPALDSDAIIAGIDQSFRLEGESDHALSAIVAMRAGEVIERVHAVTPLEIPYVPGLLAFREGGPILEAFESLSVEPDLLLFDGSGRIHFRQAGIATHIGVVLDMPSVGVAKRLLCGRPRSNLEDLPTGTRVAIDADSHVDAPEGTCLGYAVQTKQYESSKRHVNPLYVSPGHRVSADTASEVVLASTAGYKLPEPIRLADAYASELR